jgi:hypothetical protein
MKTMKTKTKNQINESDIISYLIQCTDKTDNRFAFNGVYFGEKETVSTDGRILCIVDNDRLPSFANESKIGKIIRYQKMSEKVIDANFPENYKVVIPDKFEYSFIYTHPKISEKTLSYVTFEILNEKNENDLNLFNALIYDKLNKENNIVKLSVKYLNYFADKKIKISSNGHSYPVMIELLYPNNDIVQGIKFILMSMRS